MRPCCLALVLVVASLGCARPDPPRLHDQPRSLFKGDFRAVGSARSGPPGPHGRACPQRIERVTDGAQFLLEHAFVQGDAEVSRPVGDYRAANAADGGLAPGEWLRVDCRSLVSLVVLQVR